MFQNDDDKGMSKQKVIKPTLRQSQVKPNQVSNTENMENAYRSTPHSKVRNKNSSSKKGRTSSLSNKINKTENDKV